MADKLGKILPCRLPIPREMEWEPQLLCPPLPSRPKKGDRPATYDAAGLIGAFVDKTLNEPPSILIGLSCAGLFLPSQQLLECHPRAGRAGGSTAVHF